MRLQYIILMLGLIGFTTSCSFFGMDEVMDDNERYRLALMAYEAKDYTTAMRHLRGVPLNSPSYSKALKLIKSIPYARAQSAFDEKDYRRTVLKVDKIPPSDPNYDKAQKLKRKALYESVFLEYKLAKTTAEKVKALNNLANVANEAQDQTSLLQIMELIGNDIRSVSEPLDAEPLIELLGITIESQDDIDVLDAGLKEAFSAYSQFNNDQYLRGQLLRVIANAKYKMR